ncbi:MAG: WD40 repeat domain-containing protein [Rivularia sp. (in: cyanobacteria)]
MVDFNPNNQYLASAGEDGTVKLWDIKFGTLNCGICKIQKIAIPNPKL